MVTLEHLSVGYGRGPLFADLALRLTTRSLCGGEEPLDLEVRCSQGERWRRACASGVSTPSDEFPFLDWVTDTAPIAYLYQLPPLWWFVARWRANDTPVSHGI